MSSAGDIIAQPNTSTEVVLQVESQLGGSVVTAPATGVIVASSTIPGLGMMPAAGHLVHSLSVEQRLTRYLFSR